MNHTHTTAAIIPQFEDLVALKYQVQGLPSITHTYKVNSQLAGLFASAFCGQGMDFQESRVYQEGDDVRHIDWRITARTGIPYVKLYTEQRQRSVLFCVENSRNMAFGTRQVFKCVQAARTAALLGWSAMQQQERVGGILFGQTQTSLQFFRPQKSGQAFIQLLKALSEPSPATPPDPINNSVNNSCDDPFIGALSHLSHTVQTGALIFIVADFNRDITPLETAFSYLKQRHEVVVIAIDDPADAELATMGTVLFTDGQGHTHEINTNNLSGQRRYREAWQHQRQALQSLLDRFNIALIAIRTDQALYPALQTALQQHVHRQVVR